MTWDEVENRMTWPRLKALQKQWETTPPPAITLSFLAQVKGFKLKSTKKPAETSAAFDNAVRNLNVR